MSTMTHQIQAEPVPIRPGLIVSPHTAKNPRVKWIKWIVAVGLAIFIATGALLWRAHVQNAVTYQTVPVERGSIQARVTATGTLNAVVDVQVSSQVSGNIKALYADWNSKVKKGQLVALIDPQIFQAQVDQASAEVRSTHAATITAQAQIEKAKSDLSAAIANEKNAEAIAAKDSANEANAKAQWERAKTLFSEQVIAQQDYDLAKANYDASHAQVTADRAQIDAAEQNIQSARASVQVAQSQAATAQAQEHRRKRSATAASKRLGACLSLDCRKN